MSGRTHDMARTYHDYDDDLARRSLYDHEHSTHSFRPPGAFPISPVPYESLPPPPLSPKGRYDYHAGVGRSRFYAASSTAPATESRPPSYSLHAPAYQQPDHRALRDIDQLYRQRITTPSPDHRYESPREAPRRPVRKAAAAAVPPPLPPPPPPPPHLSVISHQSSSSQSSIAPLINRSMQKSPSGPRPDPREKAQDRSVVTTEYLGAAGVAGGASVTNLSVTSLERTLPRASYYHGDGYDNFDPRDITDDGDDPYDQLAYRESSANASGSSVLKAFGARGPGGSYGPVVTGDPEKSQWLQQSNRGNRRMRWWIGAGIVAFVVAAVVAGVVGGVIGSRKFGGDSGVSNGSTSTAGGAQVSTGSSGGLWDINSPQIQSALNNKNLHKVFPGMDYTPLNAQYPDCLSNPPDQNNVTLDIAIMSQLTPAVRLYGTDCHQTEMVLTAIDRLGYNDSMKVWLGVYLDGNSTTNSRQIAQMYDILDTYPSSHFAGVIVGNEVLYAEYMSAAALESQITAVRANLTSKGISLPIATSDLGVAWQNNPSLASVSDIVMGNIHPFFAGVTAEDGTNWAWSFWQTADVPLTSATGTIGGVKYPKQIISEIGWPSQGGHDCGGPSTSNYGCKSTMDGAVANITNMNTFMDSWICAAMQNGTNYFWFEAFDEPWKHRFDTDDDKWEPYWGLMDVNRNLKSGLKIPDCGGKTVSGYFI